MEPGHNEQHAPLPAMHPQMWAPPPHQHFLPYPTYTIAPREMPWVMPHNIQEVPVHHWIPQAEPYPFPVASHPNPENPAPEHSQPAFRQEGYFFPYFPPHMYDPAVHYAQEAPPESAKPKQAIAPLPPAATQQNQSHKKKPRPRDVPASLATHRRGPGMKIESSTLLVLEVLHKPRGSQGVWKPIEDKQRLRVTLGRGKNLRLVVRPREPVDWSSLQVSLVERLDETSDLWDECPSVSNFSVESRQTIEEEDASGTKVRAMQLEVKLYSIHKTVAFRAQVKASKSSDNLVSVSYEMLTHNSGRRDAEVKRKQLEAAQVALGDVGNGETAAPEPKRPRRATATHLALVDDDDDDPSFVPGASIYAPGTRASNLKPSAIRELANAEDDENDEDFVLDNIKSHISKRRPNPPVGSTIPSYEVLPIMPMAPMAHIAEQGTSMPADIPIQKQ